MRSHRSTAGTTARAGEGTPLPPWVKPQLAALVKKAPDGPAWLHENASQKHVWRARIVL